MTNEEVTEFIKELREVSEKIVGYVDHNAYRRINKRNRLLTKAADLIESLQNTLMIIDNQALDCTDLLENHFKTQEEIERLKQQQDDYGEEIK